MQVVSSVAAMQRLAQKWHRAGARIGFVPTMGYLHEGHLSLVKRARQAAGRRGKVVVSIYVNPTQFGPKEDFSKYPRNLKRDLKLCRKAGVDVVFTPKDSEMYSLKFEKVWARRSLAPPDRTPTWSRSDSRKSWKAHHDRRIFAE